MAKGKILTVGTSDFIKKKFGIGFHLEVQIDSKVLENQQKKKENEEMDIEEQAPLKLSSFEDIQLQANEVLFKYIERVKIDP